MLMNYGRFLMSVRGRRCLPRDYLRMFARGYRWLDERPIMHVSELGKPEL